MHPLQIDERSIRRLLFWGQLNTDLWRMAWPVDAWESTVPVLASGAGYGANHICTDPLIQGRKLHTLPWSTFWTDPIFLRKQQRELLRTWCPLSSNTQKQPGSFTKENLLFTSPEGLTLLYSHRPSPWTKQRCHQRWWRGSWVNRGPRRTQEHLGDGW